MCTCKASCIDQYSGSRWAYDGKGNAVVKKLGDLQDAMRSLGGHQAGLYGEKWVNFTKVCSPLPSVAASSEQQSAVNGSQRLFMHALRRLRSWWQGQRTGR